VVPESLRLQTPPNDPDLVVHSARIDSGAIATGILELTAVVLVLAHPFPENIAAFPSNFPANILLAFEVTFPLHIFHACPPLGTFPHCPVPVNYPNPFYTDRFLNLNSNYLGAGLATHASPFPATPCTSTNELPVIEVGLAAPSLCTVAVVAIFPEIVQVYGTDPDFEMQVVDFARFYHPAAAAEIAQGRPRVEKVPLPPNYAE
jgi:hypothetical protein